MSGELLDLGMCACYLGLQGISERKVLGRTWRSGGRECVCK